MKYLAFYHEFINGITESQSSPGSFTVISISRDSYDRPLNNPKAVFINRLLSKSFYEGLDKRHDFWQDSLIASLTPNTRDYLLKLYEILNQQGLIKTTAFKDEFHRTPQSPDDQIKCVSGNHWGGFGRSAGPDVHTTSLPVPTSDVIKDLMEKTMAEKDRIDLEQLYHKLFTESRT